MSKLKQKIQKDLKWLKDTKVEFAAKECSESVIEQLDFAIRQIEPFLSVPDEIDRNVEDKIKQIQQVCLSDITNGKLQFIYSLCEKILKGES